MLRTMEGGEPVADLLGLYLADARRQTGRPWVMLNMISTIDGGTAVSGRSTGLGDDDDRLVFAAIRAVPDVVLVGAGTVRAEDYRPLTLDDERRRLRSENGLQPDPHLVILSGRLDLDPAARVFSDPAHRPMVLTQHGGDPERVEALSAVADVVRVHDLDARGIIDHLRVAGVILCEGGPSLNGQLAAAGLVDEVNLTVSPMMVAGDSRRIAHGEAANLGMRLDRALMGTRSLFLRFVRE